MSQELLARIPIFEGLKPEDAAVVEKLWHHRSISAGEILFHRSDPGDSMFLIESGSVDVMIPAQVGVGEVVVNKLGPGEFVGELALLSGMPRTATARACEDAELREMSRDDFMHFLQERPGVSISMLGEMGKRLRSTNELIFSLTSKNVNEELEGQMSLGERVADQVAEFGGSWAFIFAFAVVLFGWMGLNLLQFWFLPFDEFPFIFLNLVLSCLAAIQAPVIMMSQNRSAKKDRLKADLDYMSGVKSELMLQRLHGKMDELREDLRKRGARPEPGS